MKNDIVIKVEKVSKIYKLYKSNSDRVREAFSFRKKKKYHKDFYALNNINFEVKKGESLGIIGKNGAGKSTLLKILTGVLTPTSGNYTVNGRISALIELGAGFNPEFTGVENIYFNGSIMGYTKQQMEKLYDEIVEFADIGEHIYQPVKTYSSGMFVRLAFAVATSVKPEILIIDEALSVGDMFFQAKCADRMKEMLSGDTTLLFVSHNVGAVKSLCEKSILIDKGKIIEYGKSDDIVEKYFQMKVQSQQNVTKQKVNNNKKNIKAEKNKKEFNNININEISEEEIEEFRKKAAYNRIQNGKAEFINIKLLNEKNEEIKLVEYNQKVILRMFLQINQDIDILGFGYHIRNQNGIDILYTGSSIENSYLTNLKKNENIIVDFKFKLPLQHGKYNIATVASISIDVTIGKVDFCDFIPLAYQFVMNKREPSPLYGFVHLDNEVDIKRDIKISLEMKR